MLFFSFFFFVSLCKASQDLVASIRIRRACRGIIRSGLRAACGACLARTRLNRLANRSQASEGLERSQFVISSRGLSNTQSYLCLARTRKKDITGTGRQLQEKRSGSGSVRSVIQRKFDSTSFCASDGSEPSMILRKSIVK